jgi:phosphate transport system permease protein
MNDLANDSMTASSDNSQRIDFNTPALLRKRRMRALKDHMARWYVSIGGLAVLGAITLIFFYLAYVVMPIFSGADITAHKTQQPAWLADQGEALMLAVEEQNKVAMRLNRNGHVQFFTLKDGTALTNYDLPMPAGVSISSFSEDQPGSRRTVVGLSDGTALVFKQNYAVTYPNNVKTITPVIQYPFGEEAIKLDPQGRALEHVAVNVNGDNLLLSASTGAELHALLLTKEENQFTGETSQEQQVIDLPQIAEPIKAMIIDPRQQWLYVFNGKATADVFDLRNKTLNGRYTLLKGDAEVTAVSPLLGGISLLIGDSKGGIAQWFLVRAKTASLS